MCIRDRFNNTFIVVYPAERAADVAATLGPTFADPVSYTHLDVYKRQR